MVIRYKNLWIEDRKKLQDLYLVDGGAIEVNENMNFIVNYREKLYDAIECFWEAYVSNPTENEAKATEILLQVAEMINGYMRATNEKNIMQRIYFINNIEKEIKTIHNSILWVLHKYSIENSEETEKTEKLVIKFLQFVAVKSITENVQIEDLLNKNVKYLTQNIREEFKDKFLMFVDSKRLTYYDIYFLLGECLHQIDKTKKEVSFLENSKCEGCMIDDCMVSHCNVFDKKRSLEAVEKKYKKVFDICAKKIEGKEIWEEELNKVYSSVSDKEAIVSILSKVIKIPSIETRADSAKSIELSELTKTPLFVDKQATIEQLAKSLEFKKEKYYEDVDLIASSLLITRCDYYGADREKVLKDFENIQTSCNEISDGKQYLYKYYYLKELLRLYEEKQKNIKNNGSGEPGGE